MNSKPRLLAVIPARGGSKGLPKKNIQPLAGFPLIAHSILLAKMTKEIDRVIVSTDDAEISQVAQAYGAEIPFMRPKEIAQDDTPMWPVVRHALKTIEDQEKNRYDFVLLLDPTSPGRIPQDIEQSLKLLSQNKKADGIVGVSEPEFNPLWNCVIEKNGWMNNLVEAGKVYTRRQDVPKVFRINASLYIWRSEFIRGHEANWREGRHLIHEIPESRGIHIDSLIELKRTEILIRNGMITFPWLK